MCPRRTPVCNNSYNEHITIFYNLALETLRSVTQSFFYIHGYPNGCVELNTLNELSDYNNGTLRSKALHERNIFATVTVYFFIDF